MEDVWKAVQYAIATATVGAALPDPLAVRDQAAPPDTLVVLAAPSCVERRAGAETAQDASATVFTAGSTLLSTVC